ncbi:MAG: hypothetical protein KC656_06965 [Myxococcales bacterium]|nr:hypothetical protein [Myxococcales bacterium]MCB9668948.1 hypothetical protein [Alphaproteobacteria bacterium]MCB9691275.1 hypothetical protein [Alphaproteobacteria bacterium]
MAIVRWSRPEVVVSSEATGRRRNLDRISWRDVLDAVGKVELELKRLHTATKLSSGGDLFGTVAVEFTVDREKVTLHHVDSDPRVKPLEAGVARLIVGAAFRSSPTPMRVKLECTFESEAAGGWNPGGDDDGFFGGGGRDDREFGDPF